MSSYERHLTNPAEVDPFNVRVRAFKDDNLDSMPDTFENWTAPQVKEAVAGLQRADTRLSAVRENADAFLANRPEFLDTEKNGDVINRTLKAMYGNVAFTPEMFEKAYEVCRANNLLELDQAEIVKQQQAEADARKAAAAERAGSVTPTEAELYSMDMDELRRLDAMENQKRMRRIAEEGGW